MLLDFSLLMELKQLPSKKTRKRSKRGKLKSNRNRNNLKRRRVMLKMIRLTRQLTLPKMIQRLLRRLNPRPKKSQKKKESSTTGKMLLTKLLIRLLRPALPMLTSLKLTTHLIHQRRRLKSKRKQLKELLRNQAKRARRQKKKLPLSLLLISLLAVKMPLRDVKNKRSYWLIVESVLQKRRRLKS